VLGYRLQQRKFFEPLYQHLDLHQKQLRYTSQDKLITCLVSIMSGCQAISHIDTCIRPDRALAQAWGMACFAHQSIVADTLNHFTEIHVAQLGYPRKAGQFGVGHVLYGTQFTREFSHPAEDRPTWDIGPKAA
jgi:hypothetical protein